MGTTASGAGHCPGVRDMVTGRLVLGVGVGVVEMVGLWEQADKSHMGKATPEA